MSPADHSAVAQIAGTFDELGAYVRIVAVDLDMYRNTEKSEPPSGLTRAEINKLVYKYIGVDAGYLVGFSYQKHHDFYVESELDIDPFKYEGTTRQRFTTILEEAEPPIQARIVRGIVERYPPNSAPYRTQALNNEIQRWINRLVSADGVPVPSLRITSEVVERALADAERLISSSGATSGVDRVHTALHGYLLQVCVDQTIPAPNDASITQLFKLIRAKHPQMNDLGPRSDDIARILNSMASVLDALNPIRNLASVAHPNSRLLDDAEARLVVNVIRTILDYQHTKLQIKLIVVSRKQDRSRGNGQPCIRSYSFVVLGVVDVGSAPIDVPGLHRPPCSCGTTVGSPALRAGTQFSTQKLVRIRAAANLSYRPTFPDAVIVFED